MTKTTIFTILLFSFFTKPSQAQSDYSWLIQGDFRPKNTTNTDWATIVIDFKKNNFAFPPAIALFPDTVGFNNHFHPSWTPFSTVAVTDSLGNILLHYDGVRINRFPYPNPLNQPFEDSLGIENLTIQNTGVNLGFPQNILLIPHATLSGHFQAISIEWVSNGVCELYYSLINMGKNVNHGQGTIVIKRQLVATGNWEKGGLTLCKHPNGKDWWLLLKEQNEKVILHQFIVSFNGITFNGKQETNYKSHFYAGAVQAAFSPDGKYFAMFQNLHNKELLQVELFPFDRCTGKVDVTRLELISTDRRTPYYGGFTFSPNSKLLYIADGARLRQFDIKNRSIKTIIDFSDGPMACGVDSCYLGNMSLAPDNKIYIYNGRFQNTFSVIMNPDGEGSDCQFIQGALKLPLYMTTSFAFPNHPNYKLGKTNCIILTNDIATQDQFSLFPNPSNEQINIAFSEQVQTVGASITFFDALGRLVTSQSLDNVQSINCSTWATGLYTYRISNAQGRVLQVGKFVKN